MKSIKYAVEPDAKKVRDQLEAMLYSEPAESPLKVIEIKKEFTPLDPAKMREESYKNAPATVSTSRSHTPWPPTTKE